MFRFLSVVLFIRAYVCENTMCWTVDHISNQIMMEADKNLDGIMQMSELMNELTVSWGLTSAGLTYHDFIAFWTAQYHDTHSTAHAFVANIDVDKNDLINEADIAAHLQQFDINPHDGQIQKEEFNAFLHAVHPDPHNHGAHGCH
ncbi:uncharacterized protein LOC127855514 [Dreissena polymorpha]|uniref:EF-hand domain-containing protein n=1 Tax=Dreissena polymorpha TaxID=45954 RepID=A0A9D4CC21_DREPO|nr:uncharacterized protein LOC127855514 [Dreissena polymorpha]KAH3721406.1 hypothetical protein DPMN_064329 [Dreissena polymorpha]